MGVASVFERTVASCEQCSGELVWSAPAMVSAVARATGCTLPPACPTVFALMAVRAPAILTLSGHAVGFLSDSVLSGTSLLPGAARVVHLTRGNCGMATLCQITLPNLSMRLCLQDTVAAARQQPILYSTLRASLKTVLHRGSVQAWALASRGMVREPQREPIGDQVHDLLRASFSDPAAAADWINIVESAFPGANAAERAVFQHGALIPLLPAAHSQVVQRVLARMMDPQPDLRLPACAVYALVSPVWGKCYVGALGFREARPPLKRWLEHAGRARLWASRTSRSHYAGRCPPLYAAMRAVSSANVCFVVLETTTPALLGERERFYIRLLEPVFNAIGSVASPIAWHQAAASLGAATCDDVFSLGDRVLRQAHPRLRPSAWSALVATAAAAGERPMAVQLARVARTTSRHMRNLQALPQITVPCPVPQWLLDHLRDTVHGALRLLPHFARLPQYTVSVRAGRVSWSKSPMMDLLVAPARPPLSVVSGCQCHAMSGNKWQGHILTRKWEVLQPCAQLRELVGGVCMAQRTYPDAQKVSAKVLERTVRFLQACGFSKQQAEVHGESISATFNRELEGWLARLPPYLIQQRVRQAMRPVWQSGLVAVRIDCNPGRVIVMCVENWRAINHETIVGSARYCRLPLCPASEDPEYAKREVHSFRAALEFDRFQTAARPTRPYFYWTVKQKSRIHDGAAPKVRPIISHCRHPCRNALARVGKA